jgi:hypothetical protein
MIQLAQMGTDSINMVPVMIDRMNLDIDWGSPSYRPPMIQSNVLIVTELLAFCTTVWSYHLSVCANRRRIGSKNVDRICSHRTNDEVFVCAVARRGKRSTAIDSFVCLFAKFAQRLDRSEEQQTLPVRARLREKCKSDEMRAHHLHI